MVKIGLRNMCYYKSVLLPPMCKCIIPTSFSCVAKKERQLNEVLFFLLPACFVLPCLCTSIAYIYVRVCVCLCVCVCVSVCTFTNIFYHWFKYDNHNVAVMKDRLLEEMSTGLFCERSNIREAACGKMSFPPVVPDIVKRS